MDLRLHLADGELGFGRDSQSCSPGRGRRPGTHLVQVRDPAVQSLTANGQRLQQAIAGDTQLLHLNPVRVALVGQVGEDPLPHVASFDHRLLALLVALLDDGGRNRPRLADDLVALGLRALQPLLSGVAGRLQHAGGLVAEGFHHTGRLKPFRGGGLELGDALLERGDQADEAADLLRGLAQPAAYRLRLVAAAHRAEVGLLDRFRVQRRSRV